MHKKILAVGSALLLVAGLVALGAGPAVAGGAGGDNGGKVCQDLSTTKIGGDNQMSITVTAPAGKLISAYCVKAGSSLQGFGPQYVYLNPPVDHVTITYHYNGESKQISHYSLLYVERDTTTTPPVESPTDVCPNLGGSQSTVPNGYVMKDGNCVIQPPKPRTDVCSNMQGNQPTVPTGYLQIDGQCVIEPPTDVCPNIEGVQAQRPGDKMIDDSGNCVDIPNALAVAGSVTVTDPTCSAPGTLVLGANSFADWSDVTYSGGDRLHYSVTAIALGDRLFANGQSMFTFQGELPHALPGTIPVCVDLGTHPLVTPAVTSKNLTCNASGSYTLAVEEGTNEGIIWKADGKIVQAGTHTVKSAGTVLVTAAPNAPNFGFDFETPTSWTLTFTDAKDCGDLTTLALTGGDGNAINLGLLFAGGLLLLGGALVIAEKKARFGADK